MNDKSIERELAQFKRFNWKMSIESSKVVGVLLGYSQA